MPASLRAIFRCVFRGMRDTVLHDGIEHAGYLAFLWLLALFPFLVFVVSVLGTIGPETEVARFLTALFQRLPSEIIQALQPRIDEIASGPPQGLLTLAIVGAVWTASSAVEGLRTVLNRAYHVHTPPSYLFRRALSVLQLLLFAFVLITGLFALVALPSLVRSLDPLLSQIGVSPLAIAQTRWWSGLLYLVSLSLLLAAVAWVYYAIPNVRQRWISVLPGALAVVLLWMAAAHLFVAYLTHFTQLTLVYGSLGGIIGALLFFYICNVIFIFGAEFNHHLSAWAGMKVEEREE